MEDPRGGCLFFHSSVGGSPPFSFGLEAISAVEKSRLTGREGRREKKREKEKIDGMRDVISLSLPPVGGESVSIGRQRFTHGNKSSVGDPVLTYANRATGLIDEIFKSSGCFEHSNDND